MDRVFGRSRSQQQQLREQQWPGLGFPVRQPQQSSQAEDLFLRGISKGEAAFEKAISSLDESDSDTAGRLLCWAALNDQHSDVISRIGEKCGDFSGATLRGLTPLICAISQRHARVVEQLVAMGAPVNAVSKDLSGAPATALHCAVGVGDVDIVKALLVAGAKVDFADGLGRTALHLACEVSAVDVAVELLKHGADVNKEDKTCTSPLELAMALGSCPLMRNMISFGKKPRGIAAASFVERYRGKKGGEEMFELLVENGWGPRDRIPRGGGGGGGGSPLTGTPVFAGTSASAPAATAKGTASSGPRAPMPRGVSALHRASMSRDCDEVKGLLGSGEDPSAQDSYGRTPLHLAAKLGHVEVVQMLLRAKAAPDARDRNNLTPLLIAANAGKVAVVAALLEGGAKADLKDSTGCSALLHAVRTRCIAVVEALIAGGASLNAGGEKGETPLHAACDIGPAAMVETLLGAGALPGHCWNDNLQSPLMSACIAGNLDAVNLLLPLLSMRQVNFRDRVISDQDGGMTALVTAIICNHGRTDIVEALLKKGADPTIRMTSNNLSPLELTVSTEATALRPTLGPRLVRALVEAGAKVDEVGPQGCTALHHACFEGACGEVVQALLDAGADPCAPCAGVQFLTPLQLAGCGGNPGGLRVMVGLPECGGLNAVGAPPERATVLATAVRAGQTDGVRFLLEEGADMDLLPFKDDGITPRAKSLIHLAMAAGHGDVVSLLLQARKYKQESEELHARGVEV